jgi:hypothetical protein
MNARFFTIAEARALLPQVKLLMAQAQAARAALIRLRPDLVPALQKAAMNGGSKETGAVLPLYKQLEAGLKGIQGLGIVIKDVDQGLVDFLGRRDGREIYLCWRHGEDDIAFWHELNGGFGGRRPIDEQVA